MSQDKHYNIIDPEVPLALQDRKGTDMPAARSIIVVILVMLGAFAIVASIIYARANPDTTNSAPAQQEQTR